MTPLHQWLLVRREETPINGHPVLAMPQGYDMMNALVGTVESVSAGVRRKHTYRRLDVKPGDRIIYSSRVDAHKTKHGDYDLIEEASVIGFSP